VGEAGGRQRTPQKVKTVEMIKNRQGFKMKKENMGNVVGKLHEVMTA
jgi:hypothetical protein